MMGRRLDSTLDQRHITIGMLTAGTMNKQIVRHFQVCECTISSLRTNICKMGSVKNRNHADRPRKTTRREDMDKVASFRRYRFVSSVRIPGLLRNAAEIRICVKTFKDDCVVRACADVANTLVFR